MANSEESEFVAVGMGSPISGAVTSSPAVEMVWFQTAPQNPAPVEFGVE